jgi:hypothetical protein
MSNESYKLSGIVYKIISNKTEKIYIGSTLQTLEKRLSKHEYGYKLWIESGFEKHYCTSYEILKYKDHKIVLIKQININDRTELFKLEGYYQIENYYNCVNTSLTSPRPRHVLIDKQYEKYKCYCGREMQNKYKTRFHHVRNQIHKINLINNHKDIIIYNEVDKTLDDILDEFN